MGKSLLAEYIKLAIEVVGVPNQLIDADEIETQGNEEDVNEFSGCGAIAGFSAPLGMSSADLQPKKTKRRKK